MVPTPATPWGTALTRHPCSLRLPGQYYDPETGLHYNYLRYYDPVTAGYLSPDPLGLTPQPNPHAYVLNPTTWYDPLGLTPHDYGLNEPIRLYRAPQRANQERERYGPDPRNHMGGDGHAYFGGQPEVARQYAGNGGRADGFYEYEMKPGFLEEFPPGKYMRVHDGKEGQTEWFIPWHEIEKFNSYINRSRWHDSVGEWSLPREEW
ncbi:MULTISPECIES: RHS repeat-associated core domain-containing protein [Thermomonospora]|uniref:RHS repeat-associated core domain-containing protein n=1 Tax=Thermomonospora TaxID=2019 RepID=UPI00145C5CDE|nr:MULTISPECIES: RHS repeat-associated core domain-containing protein [Thermomonospora]